MFNAKTAVASAAIVSLTACSSMAIEKKISRYESAKNNIVKYSQHQILAWSDKTPRRVPSNISTKKTESVKAECSPSVRRAANDIMEKLSSGDSFTYEEYANSRDTATKISEDFNQCADSKNAVAEYRLVHTEKDDWITISEWVEKMRVYDYRRKLALNELEDAREKDASIKQVIGAAAIIGIAAAAAASAAYGNNYTAPATGQTNSNRHWVSGYYRSDGTYIPGHWRTNPNNTCLDNINGC